jgi:hypothetical protein
MTQDSQATLIGSAGVAILLVAFLLNLFKRLRAETVAYAALNAIGAGLACYSSYLIGFVPFVVLEGTWAVVSSVAVVRYLTSRSRMDANPP